MALNGDHDVSSAIHCLSRVRVPVPVWWICADHDSYQGWNSGAVHSWSHNGALSDDITGWITSWNWAFSGAEFRILPIIRKTILNHLGSSRISHPAFRVPEVAVTSALQEQTEEFHIGCEDLSSSGLPSHWIIIPIVTRDHQFRNIWQQTNTTDPISDFKPVSPITSRKILAFTEAILFRLRNSALCTQKLLTQTLGLLWRYCQFCRNGLNLFTGSLRSVTD